MALTIVNGKPGSEAGTGAAVLSLIMQDQRQRKLNKVSVLEEFIIWQAAWYALTGKNLYSHEAGECDLEKLQQIADWLSEHNEGLARNYAQGAYENARVLTTDLESDVFLSRMLPEMTLPDGAFLKDHPNALQEKIAAKDPMSCAEYWLQNRTDPTGEPYRHTDHSTYEYSAPESARNLAAAALPFAKGEAGLQKMTQAYVKSVKKSAITEAALKNKRTVEKLTKGDVNGFNDAWKKTKNSFTFYDKNTLKKAQQDVSELSVYMGMHRGELARSTEWLLLKSAMEEFINAKNLDVAAEKSAAFLMAVEKFTKGKKSKFQSGETTSMVNDSLKALSMIVPDATHNASVKPLIDRFNDVRKHRLQERVNLIDFGYKSALDRDPNAPVAEEIIEEYDDYQPEVYGFNRENHREAIQMNLYGKAYESDEEDSKEEEKIEGSLEDPKDEVPEEKRIEEEKIVIPQRSNSSPVRGRVSDKVENKIENKIEEKKAEEDSAFDNEAQNLIYGDNDPETMKVFEEPVDNTLVLPVEISDAYKPVRKFVNAFKANKAGLEPDKLKKAFARMIALQIVKPLEYSRNEINQLSVDSTAELLQKSKAVEMVVNTFRERPDLREKLLDNMNKIGGKPEVVLSRDIAKLYIMGKNQLKKTNQAEFKPEDLKPKDDDDDYMPEDEKEYERNSSESERESGLSF